MNHRSARTAGHAPLCCAAAGYVANASAHGDVRVQRSSALGVALIGIDDNAKTTHVADAATSPIYMVRMAS